jgi:hypothetical protein
MKKVISCLTILGFLGILSSFCQQAKISEADAAAVVNDFDASMPPPAVRPVVIVSGNAFEMGVQYGQQARDLIARNIAIIKSRTLPIWGSWDEIIKKMDLYEGIVDEKAPEIVEMWKGIAEGANLSYDDILLINLSLPLMIMAPSELVSEEKEQCSHISVWGNATKDKKLIAGANLDQGWNTGSYTVVLIAYPEKGNAFITTPPWAGEVAGSLGMNSKGLVTLGSAGQAAREEDGQIGFPNFAAKIKILLECDTIEQAKDEYLSLHNCCAENAHFADRNGAYVIEYTPAVEAVRKPGDFGENDYLIAANHFIVDKMQPALYSGEFMGGWYDAVPRYNTYQQLIKEDYGNITVDKVMAMLGCHDYWDGVKWHTDVLSLEPAADPESMWTPEMRDVNYKTLMKSVAVPIESTIYLLQGEADTRMSTIPGSTGEYCKLVLGKEMTSVLWNAQNEAKQQIWYAARDLNRSSSPTVSRDAKLEKAKLALWHGFNLQAKAGLSMDDHNKMLRLLGEATTWFCKAQMYAQQAQD